MQPDARGNGGYNDLFNPNFAKTEITSKNGSLDFGDLKSGYGDSGGMGSKGNSVNLSDKDSNGGQTSPRSPVGRTGKKKDMFSKKQAANPFPNENVQGIMKKNFNNLEE